MNHGTGDGPAPTVGPVLPEDGGEPVTLDDQRVDKGKTPASRTGEAAPASTPTPAPLQPILEPVTPQHTGRISPEALDAGSSQAEQASNAFKQESPHIKEGLDSEGGFDSVELFGYRSSSDDGEDDTVIADGSPSPKQSTSTPAKPLISEARVADIMPPSEVWGNNPETSQRSSQPQPEPEIVSQPAVTMTSGVVRNWLQRNGLDSVQMDRLVNKNADLLNTITNKIGYSKVNGVLSYKINDTSYSKVETLKIIQDIFNDSVNMGGDLGRNAVKLLASKGKN